MQIKSIVSVLLSIAVLSSVVGTKIVRADENANCPSYVQVEPSNSYRLFKADKYGISFSVPENYRVSYIGDDTMAVESPGVYATNSCFRRNNVPGDTTEDYIAVRIEKAPEDFDAWIRERKMTADYFDGWVINSAEGDQTPKDGEVVQAVTQVKMSATTAGKPFVSYFTNELNPHWNISFITDDGAKVITVTSAAVDGAAMKNLTSFPSEDELNTVVKDYTVFKYLVASIAG